MFYWPHPDPRTKAEIERDRAEFAAAQHLETARKTRRFCTCKLCAAEQARLAALEEYHRTHPRPVI